MNNENEKNSEDEILKVRMPSRRGEIEIKGTVENVQKLLKEMNLGVENTTESRRKSKTIEDHILRLIENQFFDEPRKLGEIKKEIEKSGFSYPSSSIYPVLLRKFLRKDILEREGKKGNYKYYVSEEG